MKDIITNLSAKGKSVGQTLLVFPLVLVMTIPAWIIVILASFLSEWLYDKGWWPLGAFFRIVETVLGLGLLLSTVVFFFFWLVRVGRAILGLEPKK